MPPVLLADRYLLEDVLGRGGMADVHRATDQLLSRPVAVKVLRETAHDENDRLRFTAEARTLAQLSHPGLVMVLDAGTTAERPYIVMELVEGRTWAQLGTEGPMPAEQAAGLGAQVATALAYAHEQGVVHRDVKPGNVLVTDEGRTKLADFGIARIIGNTVRHTQTGLAIGTAAYLSPEQVRGDEVTTAADVYSLGLVLVEALTGERCFPGSPTEAALARLGRDPDIPASLPQPWQELLTAMTAREPDGRPGAAEVAARLTALGSSVDPGHGEPAGPPAATPGASTTRVLTVNDTPPSATPMPDLRQGFDSVVRRVREVPSHQRGVAAAVAALVLLVVAVAVASGGDGTDDYEPPADTPSRLREPLIDLHEAVEGR